MRARLSAALMAGRAAAGLSRRLGRGGGYYDRYLAALPSTVSKIGICFALQMVDVLPTELHDVRMDAVVTESATLRLSGQRRSSADRLGVRPSVR